MTPKFCLAIAVTLINFAKVKIEITMGKYAFTFDVGGMSMQVHKYNLDTCRMEDSIVPKI